MKKTNVALSFAARIMRVLPLLFCLVLFSSADVVGQDFKSLEDAGISVKEAYKDLSDDYSDYPSLNATVADMSDAERDARLTMRVYQIWLQIADETQSVEEAWNRLNTRLQEMIVKPGQGNPTQDGITAALEDLEQLITE